jgi:hypothetical protein
MRENLEQFAQQLMARVRDKAIAATLKRLSGPTETWSSQFSSLTEEQKQMFVFLVRLQTDQALADFLGLIEDQKTIKLVVESPTGPINAVDHGDDLSAALFGRRGWIARLSSYPPAE